MGIVVLWSVFCFYVNGALLRLGCAEVEAMKRMMKSIRLTGLFLGMLLPVQYAWSQTGVALHEVLGHGTFTLEKQADGRISAWSADAGAQQNIPQWIAKGVLDDVVAIASSGSHGIALKSNGTVLDWNAWAHKENSVPAGLHDVVAVAAGAAHSLALTSKGSVVAWGDNRYGQLAVPEHLSGVVAIVAGDTFSAALKSDGTVWVWGARDARNADIRHVPEILHHVETAHVVALGVGDSDIWVLQQDGTVVTWGEQVARATMQEIALNGQVDDWK